MFVGARKLLRFGLCWCASWKQRALPVAAVWVSGSQQAVVGWDPTLLCTLLCAQSLLDQCCYCSQDDTLHSMTIVTLGNNGRSSNARTPVEFGSLFLMLNPNTRTVQSKLRWHRSIRDHASIKSHCDTAISTGICTVHSIFLPLCTRNFADSHCVHFHGLSSPSKCCATAGGVAVEVVKLMTTRACMVSITSLHAVTSYNWSRVFPMHPCVVPLRDAQAPTGLSWTRTSCPIHSSSAAVTETDHMPT